MAAAFPLEDQAFATSIEGEAYEDALGRTDDPCGTVGEPLLVPFLGDLGARRRLLLVGHEGCTHAVELGLGAHRRPHHEGRVHARRRNRVAHRCRSARGTERERAQERDAKEIHRPPNAGWESDIPRPWAR